MNFIKVYQVKLIDELGNCYYDEIICGFKKRQKFIKKWSGDDQITRVQKGDITIYIKNCGEELWSYEC